MDEFELELELLVLLLPLGDGVEYFFSTDQIYTCPPKSQLQTTSMNVDRIESLAIQTT